MKTITMTRPVYAASYKGGAGLAAGKSYRVGKDVSREDAEALVAMGAAVADAKATPAPAEDAPAAEG